MTLRPHSFHPTFLREYDARGVVGKTLSPDDARALGAAFATYAAKKMGKAKTKIAVGYDGRLSSPTLEAALREGLKSAGADVLRAGLGPTPMLYFAVKHEKCDAGMMITGSHNPPDYNGFKMLLSTGPVYGAMIQELGTIAGKGAYATGSGADSEKDMRDTYVERLLKDYDGAAPLHIVWDAGNGATGDILRRLAARLPGKHALLFDTIDGTFPNHHPDPTEEKNLKDLRARMKETGAHLGIGFDGDGDRIGALDEQGRVVAGDQMLALFARDVLRDKPGATIIADVKASETLFDDIRAHGGNALMWKTGHSLLKAKMAETGAPLAGEMSGHIFFADRYYGFDDALYAGVRLAGLVSRAGGSLAKLRDTLPSVYNTPEIRIDTTEEKKFSIVADIKKRLAAEGASVNDIDGVRVRLGDGWWLLRASNTQAVLVARVEAKSKEGLDRCAQQLEQQLKASGISSKI